MSKRFEITVKDGRSIHLESLYQYETYSGLMEGVPTRKYNAKKVQGVIRRARQIISSNGEPHLLPPPEQKLEIPEEEWFDIDEPAELPRIASMGSFTSLASARDPDADCSSLTVVWFQDEFGPPSDPEVLSKFSTIDWRSIAVDGYW